MGLDPELSAPLGLLVFQPYLREAVLASPSDQKENSYQEVGA